MRGTRVITNTVMHSVKNARTHSYYKTIFRPDFCIIFFFFWSRSVYYDNNNNNSKNNVLYKHTTRTRTPAQQRLEHKEDVAAQSINTSTEYNLWVWNNCIYIFNIYKHYTCIVYILRGATGIYHLCHNALKRFINIERTHATEWPINASNSFDHFLSSIKRSTSARIIQKRVYVSEWRRKSVFGRFLSPFVVAVHRTLTNCVLYNYIPIIRRYI